MKLLKKIFIVIVGFLVFLIITVLLLWRFSKYKEQKQYKQLRQYAEQIGENEQNLIEEYITCVGGLGAPCDIVILYLTDETSDDVEKKLSTISNDKYAQEADGYRLFTDIHTTRDQTITVNGNDGTSKRQEISKPKAKKWIFTDENSNRNRLSVTYYDIQSSDEIYELNHSKIDKNIVKISLKLE